MDKKTGEPQLRRVFQTRKTNCFQACVASVLGLAIDEVPDACDGAIWDWNAFQDWLAGRGMQAVEIKLTGEPMLYPVRAAVMCILSGKSPRECLTGMHAIVGELTSLEEWHYLHDPHESGEFIVGEPTHATFFVPIQKPVVEIEGFENEALEKLRGITRTFVLAVEKAAISRAQWRGSAFVTADDIVVEARSMVDSQVLSFPVWSDEESDSKE